MGWIILLIAIGISIYFFKSRENNQVQINDDNTSPKRPRRKSTRRSRSSPNVKFGDMMLRVRDINFYGPYNRSENKIFTVGCDDSDYKAGYGETKRGGFRKDGMGRAILLKNKKLKWSKEFERPHDGEVSNEGYMALNDWLFGEGLKGKFYVLNPDGNILIEDKLSANLQDLGITMDSRLAWTTTAASDNSYSNQLFVYDIAHRKRLFKRDRLYGQIEKSAMQNDCIEFTTNQNIYYKFGLAGKLLNEDEVKQQIEDQKLNSNDLWAVHSIAKEKIAKFESDNFDKDGILKIIQKLRELDSNVKDKYLAKTYRYQGELKLILGRKEEALSDFENALELDSKVGIKRKTKKLRKEFS
jgi:tetratricopeptide (TPR) repeat protein